ncbi:MAG: DNA repair protein RecO [Flavobacteriales bacterium]|nr:DNA repair protein RecO [Flavobacteriales bacterium]
MLRKARGIVLHSIKQGDSGRIVKIYTAQHGLTPFYLRSTYSKKKGPSSALYQPMRILDLEIDFRQSRRLQSIMHAQSGASQSSIYIDPVRTCLALFMAEVLLNCLEEEETSIELYDHIERWIITLEDIDELSNFPIEFMLSLSEQLGFYPHVDTKGDYFDLREGTFHDTPPHHKDFLDSDISSSLRTYHGTGFVAERPLIAKKKMRRRLLEGLMQYYRIHVPQFKTINSFKVLSEVFDI